MFGSLTVGTLVSNLQLGRWDLGLKTRDLVSKEVLNSFWALEFLGPLAVLESIRYLNLGSGFQDLDRQTDTMFAIIYNE